MAILAVALLLLPSMVKSVAGLKQTAMAVATALLIPVAGAAQSVSDVKLDESLRESLERGCVGTQPVIVRTKPGYREGLRNSLAAHGDLVKGEFPALDAVAVDVHCDDLAALAAFDSTASISLNGPVAVQSLVETGVISDAQAAVGSARAALVSSKAAALDAQGKLRAAEKAAAAANAQVTSAKRALILANRLTGIAKINAVAAAQAALAQAEAAAAAAQAARHAARTNATRAQATALSAQNALVEARQALLEATATVAGREREGRAARDLKRKFFATMPVRASNQPPTKSSTTKPATIRRSRRPRIRAAAAASASRSSIRVSSRHRLR